MTGTMTTRAALLLAFLLGPVVCPAAETFVTVSKTFGTIALDASAFRARGAGADRIVVRTLLSDLKRSGWFSLAAKGSAAYALRGHCQERDGLVVAELTVRSSAGKIALGKSYELRAAGARRLAHRMADEIVYTLTGHKGIASTRIVMVGARGGGKELYSCDVDGHNLQQLTRDKSVSLAPRWDPQGRRLVYTSFKSGFPDVYLIDLTTSNRERIAKFPGLNSGADFSPDGRSIALTLSKDANPELYIMSLRGRKLTRLTRTRNAAETSPTYSPDGRQIAFVSDSSGSPQIYVIGRNGGERRRITFEGRENVAPDWSSDGRIAYSSRRFGRYQICIHDPAKKTDRQVTREDVEHEDPSWAPDARHIVYTRTQGHDARIYLLDTVTGASIALHNLKGAWYTPAWSPN